MNSSELEKIIARELRIPVEQVTDDLAYMSTQAWDSLRHVALIVALEKALGSRLEEHVVARMGTVGAIRQCIGELSGGIGRAGMDATATEPQTSEFGPAVQVHRGLENIYVDRSGITSIDGQAGTLEYRGYSIHDLVEHSSYEETVWLLIKGTLPNTRDLADFQAELSTRRTLTVGVLKVLHALTVAHPLEALRTGVSALGALCSAVRDESPDVALSAGLDLVAQAPMLIAAHHALRHHRDPPPAREDLGHAANFVYMLTGSVPSAQVVRVMDQDMILHADHGASPSAFTARVTTGSHASIHAAITAAVASFSGSLHGGAVYGVMESIDAVGSPDNAANYVRQRLAEGLPIMGFGHRVYKTEDPRVRHFRRLAQELCRQRGDERELQIIEKVIEAMEPYSAHGVWPNVDLYSGLIYRMLGFGDDLAVAIFAAGRMAGWVAQSLEQKSNNVLIRPRLLYEGLQGQQYCALDKR
jgi:citrate synthase